MVPGGFPGRGPGEPGGTEKQKMERRGHQERRPLVRSPPFRHQSRQKSSPGAPQGAIWESFLMSFRGVFSRFFLVPFFIDFGRHSGSILAPLLIKKWTQESRGRQQDDHEKSLFYLRKTILFDFGGCPRTPKIGPGGVIKSDKISQRFLGPKGVQKGPQNTRRWSSF